MDYYYFDTSALVKLYISETGSQWATQIYRASGKSNQAMHIIAFSKIAIVEVASAIARLENMQAISQEQRRMVYTRFMRDTESRFELIKLTDRMLRIAASMAQRWVLRGYDAVHLASASVFNSVLTDYQASTITFVSADKQLCQAAIQEGFTTINPNDLSV